MRLVARPAGRGVRRHRAPLAGRARRRDRGHDGYLIEQELSNVLPASRTVATLLTRVEVDPHDPAFERPTKPIGPVYTRVEAACAFVRATGKRALIGPLEQIEAMLAGTAGTEVSRDGADTL